jgi:hypothetical protein
LFGEAPTGLWFPLSQNLSVLPDRDRIIAYPWPVDKRPRYRFEVDSAREAQLAAALSETVADLSRGNFVPLPLD